MMIDRRVLLAIFPVLPFVIAAPPRAGLAAELPVDERTRIERLIQGIEQLTDAQFVRNGRAYDAATAGTFLRRKWASREDQVHSAADFIVHVASSSSTTGRPYLIRFPDGREVPCGDYLRAELRRLAP
jgi:hypothetical protein